MSKEKKEVRNHLKRCVIVNGLIKCKIKLLNLQYFDAPGHKFILTSANLSRRQVVSPRSCCDHEMYPHPATARHSDMHCCRVGPASWCSTGSPAPASWQPPRHHWHWSCCPLASCSGTMITIASKKSIRRFVSNHGKGPY